VGHKVSIRKIDTVPTEQRDVWLAKSGQKELTESRKFIECTDLLEHLEGVKISGLDEIDKEKIDNYVEILCWLRERK